MSSGDAFALQGLNGGQVYSGTDSAVGPFRKLYVQTDSILSAYAGNLVNGSTKLVAATLPAGTEIGGITESFTLTSGLITAYRIHA